MQPQRRIVVIAAVLVAVVLAAAPAFAYVPDQPPNVVGLPGGDAEKLLLDSWSDRVLVTFTPVGGQPPAGTEIALAVVDKQRLVNPDWQKTGEPPRVELFVAPAVPNLVGLRRGDAGALLTRHGLVLAPNPARAPADWVVDKQQPDPNGRITWGARVLVSLVPPPSVAPVKVPDLRGMTRAEAAAAVGGLGLVLNVSGPANGRVAAQDPDPNTEVQPGSAVSVTLRAEVAPSTSPEPPPPGPRPWVPVVMVTGGGGLLILVLALAALLLMARNGRRPRWVRAHVRAEPRLGVPEARLSGSPQGRAVRVRATAGQTDHVFEEVGP